MKVLVPLIILALAVAVVYVLSISKKPPEVNAVEKKPPPRLQVETAKPETRQLYVSSQGTVRPKSTIMLSSQVMGQVTAVADSFTAGGFFNRGDWLVKVDDRDYRIAVVRAKSKVASAEEVLATEKARARQAKKEWRDLGRTESNALFLRQPQLKAAAAALLAAKADLQQAELNLSRTVIRAPFTGRVESLQVNQGQFVNVGMQLAQLYATDWVQVPLPLTEAQLPLLDLPLTPDDKRRVPVVLQHEGGGQWQGFLVRTEASVDTRSRVLYGIVEVENPFKGQQPLLVGMFVTAKVSGKTIPDVLEVNSQQLYEGNHLLAVDANNRVQVLPVTILQANAADEAKVLVTGVSNGQRILLERPSYLTPDLLINPVGVDDAASGVTHE